MLRIDRCMRLKNVDESGCFHLMSRTVGGRDLFGSVEREVLRKMIWQVAQFSGLQVLTYAIMKNHFHLLVKCPADEEVSDEELVRRFRILYPKSTPWQPVSADFLERILRQNGHEAAEWRSRLHERMHDISWLMRTIKQRFTRWYNRIADSYGTVWADRFKSVRVEGDHLALRTVAAYIDLNAVRAGLVDDPKDYRFCGYGEALGGGKLARAGLHVIDPDIAGYRQTLYGYGSGSKVGKCAIPREEAVRVLEEEKGKLPISVILRCRVRYFSDGIVIGSPEFVRKCREEEKGNGAGIHKARAHPMEGADWGGLAVGTGLRKDRFG